jgi:hypothetical protein
VRFEYAETQPAATAVDAGAVSPGLLASVPAALLEELRHAAVLLDVPRCIEISARIGTVDRDLGARLRSMLDNLRYEELLEVLDQSVCMKSA